MAIIGRVYDATIASFATSIAVNLGKPYTLTSVEIPTMVSNTTWTLYGSTDGLKYRTLNADTNSAIVQFAPFTVPSALTNAFVNAPPGFQFYKIDLANVISFTAGFKFVCYDAQ